MNVKVHVSLFELFSLLSNISWARTSHFETCCSTLRHIVWCWVILHTNSLPRRPWQDCTQAVSYFVKTFHEPECLILRQAVRLQDILSDLETCLTQNYCQDARIKIACKLSHLLSRMSMSRLSDFETPHSTASLVSFWDKCRARLVRRSHLSLCVLHNHYGKSKSFCTC